MPEAPTPADTIRRAAASMGRAAETSAACQAAVSFKPHIVALLADALIELADSYCTSATDTCARCAAVLRLARGVLGEEAPDA